MKKVVKFLQTWNEWFSLPMAFAVLYFSPIVIRWFDPTAAIYDLGVLQKPLLAIVYFLILNFVAWLIVRTQWPAAYHAIDQFSETSNDKYKWGNLKVYLLLFAAYLFLLILCLLAV